MKKYLVKHRRSGATREMTEASYKLAGEKRGWQIVSEVTPNPAQKSIVQQEMDKLIAEQKAKISSENEDVFSEVTETVSEVKEEPKRRGPKKKNNEA